MSGDHDDFTLLCERCGYLVESLPRDGPCPECGRPIRDSLPQRRPGSPWQQSPGAASWVRTSVALLRHPVAFWRDIRIESQRGGYGRVNVWAAAILVASVTAVRIMREYSFHADGPPSWASIRTWTVWLAWVFPFAALFAVVGGVLTEIESLGVRFFGNRRGWRVTRTVADAVCTHASIGWFIAGVSWAAAALAIDSGLARRLSIALDLPIPGPSAWLRAVFPMVGLFLGLLVFEFLVFFGVRQNRFANRADPGR